MNRPPVASLTRTPILDHADAELFAAARLRAARMAPYMASAIFSLVPVTEPGYGTFAVDRWWRVYLDFDVARRWGIEATAGVLLHEAHHVVRDHHGRGSQMDVPTVHRRLWNFASDAAINDDLLADEVPLPDPLLPHHLGFENGGIEETYYRRLRKRQCLEERPSCGSGAGGPTSAVEIGDEPDESGIDGIDEVDAKAVRRAVARDTIKADETNRADGRSQGVSPGLLRWARDLLQPQVPWQNVLRSVLGKSIAAQVGRQLPDWSRADRRADSRPDFPRPGRRRHAPDIAVVVDTSASMSEDLLDAAVTEINSLLHRCGIRELTVVVCDEFAARPQRVRRLGQLILRGGGATDLRVGMSAAADARPAPSVIVVLTDGLTPWPRAAPRGADIIAVVIGERAPLPEGVGIRSLRIAEPS